MADPRWTKLPTFLGGTLPAGQVNDPQTIKIEKFLQWVSPGKALVQVEEIDAYGQTVKKSAPIVKDIEGYPQPEATATGGIGGIGSAGLPDEEAFQRKRTIMGDTVDVANMAMQAWLEALPYMVPDDRETVAGSDALSQALGGVGISYAPRPQHKVKLDLQDFMKQAATALGYDSYMPGATQGASQGMGQGISQGGDTSAQDKSIDEYLDMVLQEQKNEELAMTGQVTDPNYMPRTMTNEFTGANSSNPINTNFYDTSNANWQSIINKNNPASQTIQDLKAITGMPKVQVSSSDVVNNTMTLPNYGRSKNPEPYPLPVNTFYGTDTAQQWLEIAQRIKDFAPSGLNKDSKLGRLREPESTLSQLKEYNNLRTIR